MNKSQIFLYRHFSDRHLETITGLNRRTIGQYRRGERSLNEMQEKAFRRGYGAVQYHRLRSVGYNRRDAQKIKYDTPKEVNSRIRASVRIAEIIATSEIQKMKENNRKRVQAGNRPKRVPDIEKKIKTIMRGMAKSDVPEEEREYWAEKYANKK
jgi:hypothetical protein